MDEALTAAQVATADALACLSRRASVSAVDLRHAIATALAAAVEAERERMIDRIESILRTRLAMREWDLLPIADALRAEAPRG